MKEVESNVTGIGSDVLDLQAKWIMSYDLAKSRTLRLINPAG